MSCYYHHVHAMLDGDEDDDLSRHLIIICSNFRGQIGSINNSNSNMWERNRRCKECLMLLRL